MTFAPAAWAVIGRLALAPVGTEAVEVQGQSPCSSAEAIEADVRAALGDERAVPNARISYSEHEGEWTAVVELGAGGSQTLTGAKCLEVHRAVVVVLAAAAVAAEPKPEPEPEPPDATGVVPEPEVEALQPTDSDATPPSSPPTEPGPEAGPKVTPASPPAASTNEARGTAISGGAGVMVGLGIGQPPGLGAQFGVVGDLMGPRWRVEVSAAYAAPHDHQGPAPGQRGRVQGVSLSGLGCWVRLPAKLRPGVCGGLMGGVMIGRGAGRVVARTAGAGWLAAAAGPALHFERPRWGLVLAGEAWLNLVRPRFFIEGSDPLCCEQRVGGRIRLSVRFPVGPGGKNRAALAKTGRGGQPPR